MRLPAPPWMASLTKPFLRVRYTSSLSGCCARKMPVCVAPPCLDGNHLMQENHPKPNKHFRLQQRQQTTGLLMLRPIETIL